MRPQAVTHPKHRNGDYMAFQRQQRRAQARQELRSRRAEWQVWEAKAAEQAEQQRRKAKKIAQGLELRVEESEFGRPVSDADLDVMQEKFRTGARRYEDKQSWAGRRKQLYKGVNDLDPSGQLGRKVERLSALTQDLRNARSHQQWGIAEQPEPMSLPAQGAQAGSVEPTRWPEAGRSWGNDAEFSDLKAGSQTSGGVRQSSDDKAADYDWTGAAAAAFPRTDASRTAKATSRRMSSVKAESRALKSQRTAQNGCDVIV